jgi:starch synthase
MRVIYPVLWSRLGREASQDQTVKTAAALSRAGIEVTLILPRGRYDPALGAEDLRQWFVVEGDFRIRQVPSHWAGAGLFRSSMWLRQVFRSAAILSAELVYSRAPVMIAAGQLCPIPFVTDLYRNWPDQWPLIRPLVRRTALHPKCLGYILHSHFAAESYRKALVPEAKLLVAHNGVDRAVELGRADRSAARERLSLAGDAHIAVYAGRMNGSKGLDQILSLADLRPQTLFLMVGSEGDGSIERQARKRQNIQVVGWQSPKQLPDYLAAADLLLIPASRDPLERFGTSVLPIKTLAYLSAGRPILGPRSPDLADLLVDGQNALLVTPGDPKESAAALDRLRDDGLLAARVAEGAARTARGLSWDNRAALIVDFLHRRLADVHSSA